MSIKNHSPNNHPQFLHTSSSLRSTFQNALIQSSDLHIAVAWMRSGWVLDEICNSGIRIHAVVGTSFGMTDPSAIEALAKHDKASIRVVSDQDNGGIFHPKLFCFSKGRSSTALIGSMNMTRAAFSDNCELGVMLMLSPSERQEILQVWSKWNEQAIKPTQRWIDNYSKQWKQRARRKILSIAYREDGSISNAPEEHGLTKLELLHYSWRSYLHKIRSHAEWRNDSYDIISDKHGSYLTSIRLAGPLLNKPLPAPSTTEFRCLTGRTPTQKDPQIDCGYLGDLSSSGYGIHALGNDQDLRRKIERLVPRLRAAESRYEKLDAAKQLWDAMTSFPYVANAMVTRFCALVRPDSFYSLNQRSIKVLSKILEIPESRLKSWDGYAYGLQAFWSSPWWNAEPPKSKSDRQVWDARVALIDVLAYTPPT